MVKIYKSNKDVGIDIGLKDFAVLSTGEVFTNPKFLRKIEHKLFREQRTLTRRKKNSNNWNKQPIKVARLHERITNARADYLHKISPQIAKNNDVIAIEDLQVSNMLKNQQISQSH